MEFVESVFAVIPSLIKAIPIVAQLAVGAMVLALTLGLLIALARISKNKILNTIAVVYVEILRGTPLLVQLVYVYFVLPVVGINLEPVAAGIIALGLNYAAYLSEVYRTSILAIDKGQTEAALSLGYTPTKTLWKIVIPQSFTIALGPIGNYFIAMVKDTALTSVIAVSEILKTANTLNAQTFQTVPIYTAAALLYLALSLPLSRLVIVLERKVRNRA